MSLEDELLSMQKARDERTDQRLATLEALNREGNGMLQRLVDIHVADRADRTADREARLALEKAKIEGRSKAFAVLFTPAGFAAIGGLLTTIGTILAGWFGWHKADAP